MVFSLQPTSDPSVAIGTIGAGLRWNSSFALLRSAVSAEKAAALLAAARSLSFEERPDSVDGLPSHGRRAAQGLWSREGVGRG